mmetsp:Transcript_73948/g.164315  ORF Transcript_73948/g.164315 Transcript_73948/m.164315 type:complete len:263 (-) Transcript_73948:1574-2362(-)
MQCVSGVATSLLAYRLPRSEPTKCCPSRWPVIRKRNILQPQTQSRPCPQVRSLQGQGSPCPLWICPRPQPRQWPGKQSLPQIQLFRSFSTGQTYSSERSRSLTQRSRCTATVGSRSCPQIWWIAASGLPSPRASCPLRALLIRWSAAGSPWTTRFARWRPSDCRPPGRASSPAALPSRASIDLQACSWAQGWRTPALPESSRCKPAGYHCKWAACRCKWASCRYKPASCRCKLASCRYARGLCLAGWMALVCHAQGCQTSPQ